jgi:nitric oxide reductase NorQ protein
MADQEKVQSLKNQDMLDSKHRRTVEEKRSYKKGTGRITIKLRKQRNRIESPLFNSYNIQELDLHPGYWFEKFTDQIPSGVADYVDDGNQYVERIIEALYHFKQCALIGPSGTGKTHITYLVAELTGLPIWEINCALQTSTYDLIGRYVDLGKDNWIDGPVTLWLKHGGLLYLDEANMMRQDVAVKLNPILDARGHLIIAEKDNEIVQRHKHAYCVMSINPRRTEFTGTKRLNVSFRRRLSVWINFEYQSVGEKISSSEVKLIMQRSGIDEETAIKILKVGAELRRQYLAEELFYGPSPRDLINWAILLKIRNTPVQAAESTIIALISDDNDIQEYIRNLIIKIFA